MATGQVAPTHDDVRAQLERLLASAEFSEARRLSAFLRYVTEETLAGRQSELKGYSIGVAVFERGADFDPNIDPIVRVEATRLRRALSQYYAGAGARDGVVIELPRGNYTPTFHTRVVTGAAANENARARFGVARFLRQPIWLASAVVLVIALVSGTVWLLTRENLTGFGDAPGPVVFVLPLQNLSGDPEREYFSRGLTVEVAGELSRFKDLVVVSPERGSEREAIAKTTVAVPAYILDGSLRSSGDQVRVTAELTDGRSGAKLWSNTFDKVLTVDNLLTIESEIAASIVRAVGQPYGVISQLEVRRPSAGRPSNMQAYDCVLRAYDYWRELSATLHEPVRACLERTTAQDPSYAAAWAALTFLTLDEYRYGYNPRPGLYNPLDRALETAQRAVAIDANNAVSFQALYAAYYFRGELDKFREAGERALALNPNSPDIVSDYGNRLALSGDWGRGIALVNRAIDLNPAHPGWYYIPLVYDAYRRGAYDEALRLTNDLQMPEFWRVHVLRTMILAEMGNADQAAQSLARVVELRPDFEQKAADYLTRWHLEPDLHRRCIESLRKAGINIAA